MESLDQKILLLFGQEYHPPRFLLHQYRNAQQSEHQVPLEIQKMINKFVFVERCRFIFGFKRWINYPAQKAHPIIFRDCIG